MASKINVLHISTEKTWRGGEQQIAYLIKNLPKQNVESIIFVLQNSAFHTYLKSTNFKYIAYKNKSVYSLKNLVLLKKAIKNFKINFLHCHTSKAHTLSFIYNLFFKNVKTIVARRVDFKPKNTFLSKWKYNHKSIVKYICVSKKIEEIIKPFIKQKQNICTIYSGINLNKWKNHPTKNILKTEFNIKPTTKIIGNIAALETQKDVYTFIKVANQLKNKDLVFVVVGSGSLKEKLLQFANQLKLKNIIFTGFRKDVEQILPCFDVFLFTSQTEGLGTILLDAMAAKVAIVTTNAGGITEIVKNKETGLTANVGDFKKLSENVMFLLIDKPLKQSLISAAFNKIDKFSCKNTANKTYKLYINKSKII